MGGLILCPIALLPAATSMQPEGCNPGSGGMRSRCGWGSKPNKFHKYLDVPVAMARKNKMHKKISNVHLETVSEGNWSSFLRLDKLQDSMQFAYIDKVRVSYTFDEPDSNSNRMGLLFVSSMDSALDSTTPANNDGQIISSTARHGAAGVVTLPIKRRVTNNETTGLAQESRTGFPIYLHIRTADFDEATKIYLVIETFGTFFKATSL